MEVLGIMQMVIAFMFGVSLCFLNRSIFLYIVEGFVALGGIVLCLFPRIFHEKHLELLHLEGTKDGPSEIPNLYLLHILGGLQLGLVLISHLSRSGSNDETISRNVMTMWAQRFCLDVVVYLKLLITKGTISKTVGGKTTESFSFSSIPEGKIVVFVVMLGILAASVSHLVRWPVFRSRTCMATRDRTNLHLLIHEIYAFFVGLINILSPEIIKIIPGFTFPLDVNTLLMTRSVGVVFIILAVYIHHAQTFYDSRDKAPVFQAAMFMKLTQMIHMGVYFYQLPHFPLHFFMVELCLAALIFLNCLLGLFTALNGRTQLNPTLQDTSCTSYTSYSSYSSRSESEEDVMETSEVTIHETKIEKDLKTSEKKPRSRRTRNQ